ncbi:hypothetical protein CALCODRAFT_557641 [Calocera cornea HHB12733]|uniref:Uncharacterized protein n=1 Tax=Calocera cornea HHB12733 TaxID=1353952 RepID=A0A165DNW8_9BASI|nr:hypothetical protein CALCODRAFT_557641 [Calocera cornea HHB12733]
MSTRVDHEGKVISVGGHGLGRLAMEILAKDGWFSFDRIDNLNGGKTTSCTFYAEIIGGTLLISFYEYKEVQGAEPRQLIGQYKKEKVGGRLAARGTCTLQVEKVSLGALDDVEDEATDTEVDAADVKPTSLLYAQSTEVVWMADYDPRALYMSSLLSLPDPAVITSSAITVTGSLRYGASDQATFWWNSDEELLNTPKIAFHAKDRKKGFRIQFYEDLSEGGEIKHGRELARCEGPHFGLNLKLDLIGTYQFERLRDLRQYVLIRSSEKANASITMQMHNTAVELHMQTDYKRYSCVCRAENVIPIVSGPRISATGFKYEYEDWEDVEDPEGLVFTCTIKTEKPGEGPLVTFWCNAAISKNRPWVIGRLPLVGLKCGQLDAKGSCEWFTKVSLSTSLGARY